MSNSQHESDESLQDLQRMRLRNILTDLQQIAAVLPKRVCLQNASPWSNLTREPPYEPFEKGQQMIRDAAKAARRLSQDKQDEFRASVIVFYKTLEEDALEAFALPVPRTDVVNLFQKAEQEQTEAVCDGVVAFQAPSPANDLAVARRFEEAAVADEAVAQSFRNRAKGMWTRATQ